MRVSTRKVMMDTIKRVVCFVFPALAALAITN
jgi:hypothetical protein